MPKLKIIPKQTKTQPNKEKTLQINSPHECWAWRLTPLIPAIQKVEIGKIVV
jgi:hypothetical protein